jgi:uncharacterized protein YbcI
MNQTKGQIEAIITEEIVKFEMDFMGHGPASCRTYLVDDLASCRTYLVDDLVLVHLKGALTQSEYQLCQAGVIIVPDGGQTTVSQTREMVKSMRRELLERGRHLLEKAVNAATGQNVVSLHTDISTINGDRVIVFLLDNVPQIIREVNLLPSRHT